MADSTMQAVLTVSLVTSRQRILTHLACAEVLFPIHSQFADAAAAAAVSLNATRMPMNGGDAVAAAAAAAAKKLGHPPRRFIHPAAAGRTIVSQQLLSAAAPKCVASYEPQFCE